MLSLFLGLTLAFVTDQSGQSSTIAQAENSSTSHAEVQQEKKDPNNYTLAYKKSVQEDKPLMVVVGAPWCPACETLKKTTIANMQQSGELDQVSVAVVDRDAEPELAKQLLAEEKMIPQIIVYSKNADGRWNRTRLKGYQPVQPVRSLLRSIVRLGRS